MKRTFLVTVEGASTAAAWFEPEYIRGLLEAAGVEIAVTETTATHAKEKEVIEAAMEQQSVADNDFISNGWFNATDRTEDKARELRALMEGKG